MDKQVILSCLCELKHGWLLIGEIIGAMTSAMAYDGWINLTLSGRNKNPVKNIPRSLIMGLFGCIVIYVTEPCFYIYLPIDSQIPLVASMLWPGPSRQHQWSRDCCYDCDMYVRAINSCNMSEARLLIRWRMISVFLLR
jgi:hypothetical protein